MAETIEKYRRFWHHLHILRLTAHVKCNTVNPVLSGHLKIDKSKVLMEKNSLMKI